MHIQILLSTGKQRKASEFTSSNKKLSRRKDRAMLRVTEYFSKSLKVIHKVVCKVPTSISFIMALP